MEGLDKKPKKSVRELSFTPLKVSLPFVRLLVRELDPLMPHLETIWGAAAVNVHQFVDILSNCVLAFLQGKNITHFTSLDMMYRTFEEDEEDETDEFLEWERTLLGPHSIVSTTNGTRSIETFEIVERMHYCLASVFLQVDTRKHKKVTYSDFRAFVLNIHIGNIGDTEVKPIVLRRTVPCKAVYHMNRIKYQQEENMMVVGIADRAESPAQLRLMNAQSLDVTQETTMKMSEGSILSMEVIPVASALQKTKTKFVFVCMSDGRIRAFDFHKLQLEKVNASLGSPQSVVLHVAKLGLLVFGSRSGALTTVSTSHFDKMSSVQADTLKTLTPLIQSSLPTLHEETISDAVLDISNESIFTSSLDRLIKQVHLRDLSILRVLSGHELGVLSVAFNAHYNSLVSCGLETSLRVWTLEVTNIESAKMNDASHPYTNSVVQVQTVKSKPLVVSMDVKGKFKVWDLRILRCVCTVSCEPELTRTEMEVLNWTEFYIDPISIDVVTSSNRKLYIFEYDVDDRALGPYCAHEGVVTGTTYDSRSHSIVSVAKRELQVWNAETCEPISKLREITTDKCTATLVLEKLGLLIVGSLDGSLVFISTATLRIAGQWLHQSAQSIVAIVELPCREGIASVSATGQVECVFCEFKSGTLAINSVVLSRNGLPMRGTCVACFTATTFKGILLGESDNAISVWISSSCCDTSRTSSRKLPFLDAMRAVNIPSDREVTSVCAVGSTGGFICCDARGWFHMWGCDGATVWFLWRWCGNKPSHISNVPRIHKIAVCDRLNVLYAGDVMGYINVYDIQLPLILAPVSEADAIGDIDRRPILAEDLKPSMKRSQLLPRCICSWEAHGEAEVTDMIIIKDPLCLLTCGSDCRLQLWTTGGNFLAMFIMTKVGETFVESQSGIDFSTDGLTPGEGCWERYHDLPPPYGRERKGIGILGELMVGARRLSGDSSEKEEDLTVQQQDAPPEKEEEFLSSLLSSGTRMEPNVDKETRKNNRVDEGQEPAMHLKKLRQRVIERPSTLILSSTEVLYSVPQYIGIEKVFESERPRLCHYAPQENVDHAMYGPDVNFRRLHLKSLSAAHEKAVQLHIGTTHSLSGSPPALRSRSTEPVIASSHSPERCALPSSATPEILPDHRAWRKPRDGTFSLNKTDGSSTQYASSPKPRRPVAGVLPPLTKSSPSPTVSPGENAGTKGRKFGSVNRPPRELDPIDPLRRGDPHHDDFLLPQVRPLAGVGQHAKSHAAKAF